MNIKERYIVAGSGRCGTHNLWKLLWDFAKRQVWTTHDAWMFMKLNHEDYKRIMGEAPAFSVDMSNWGAYSYSFRNECWDWPPLMDFIKYRYKMLIDKYYVLDGRYKHHYGKGSQPIRVDICNTNSAYIYAYKKRDPNIKTIVMIRDPEETIRSMIDFDVRGLGPFTCSARWVTNWKLEKPKVVNVQPTHGKKHGYYVDYDGFYYDVYSGIKKQFEMLGENPDLVIELKEYSKGKYLRRLANMFQMSTGGGASGWVKQKSNSLGRKNQGGYQSRTGKFTYNGPMPDLDRCYEIYRYWKGLAKTQEEKNEKKD